MPYWSRCDALGQACIDLPGPTPGEQVDLADIGGVVELRIVASNELGTAQASALSDVVPPLPLASYTSPAGQPPLPGQAIPPLPAGGASPRVVGQVVASARARFVRARLDPDAVFSARG
jgi:hypothetical protein